MFRFILFFFILLIALEIILNSINPSPYESDKTLGWKLKKNFSYNFKKKTYAGKNYIANYSTNENGIIEFNKKTNSKKILVIGDSFSTDPNVGNEHFWYSVMAKKLEQNINNKISVFASGGGGYGTVQEYLVAKEITEKINPHLIILQFCINDFENNNLDWEKKIYRFTQYMRRPYSDMYGNIYRKDYFINFIPDFVANSRLFNSILSRLGNFISTKYPINLNTEQMQQIKIDSIQITTMFLEKIYNIKPETKKIIVNCKKAENYPEVLWDEIANKIGYVVINKNFKFVENAIIQKEDIYSSDGGHYNIIGNHIFGTAIADEILDKKILTW
jgi:lysophospholipase L1-like esterase